MEKFLSQSEAEWDNFVPNLAETLIEIIEISFRGVKLEIAATRLGTRICLKEMQISYRLYAHLFFY